jgi:predicted phosphodiesterase
MAEGIKVIRVELPQEIEKMVIVPIGDAHDGERWFDIDEFKSAVQFIKDDPNRYAIINGDLFNNAIKTSVSDIYEEERAPEEQIKSMVEILKPIREKILAMGTGNHEERTTRLTGIDPSRYAAVRLGIEDRYSDNSFVLFISVGRSHTYRIDRQKKQVYTIFVQHGFGGGKRNGSKLNNLNDADKIVADADLYIMGHTHTPIANVGSVFVSDIQNKTLVRKNKYFLMHNAFLRFGGYGLRQGFSPVAIEVTYATLFTQGRKRISLTIGI